MSDSTDASQDRLAEIVDKFATADQSLALGRRVVACEYVAEVVVEAGLWKASFLSRQGEAVVPVVAEKMRSH